MKPSKLIIAAFALSATAALAAGNQVSSTTSQDDTVKQAQQALNDKGFDAGTADGVAGPHTGAAVKKFQESQKINASGELDQQTLAALGVSASGTSSSTGTSTSSSPSSSSSSPPSSSSSSTSSPSSSSSMSGSMSSPPSSTSSSPSSSESSTSGSTK